MSPSGPGMVMFSTRSTSSGVPDISAMPAISARLSSTVIVSGGGVPSASIWSKTAWHCGSSGIGPPPLRQELQNVLSYRVGLLQLRQMARAVHQRDLRVAESRGELVG